MDGYNYEIFEHYECDGQLSFEDCFSDYIETVKSTGKDELDEVSPIVINKPDTPTAKARWVLMYIHFQIYSKAYKTNEFP